MLKYWQIVSVFYVPDFDDVDPVCLIICQESWHLY